MKGDVETKDIYDSYTVTDENGDEIPMDDEDEAYSDEDFGIDTIDDGEDDDSDGYISD